MLEYRREGGKEGRRESQSKPDQTIVTLYGKLVLCIKDQPYSFCCYGNQPGLRG